MLRKTHPRSHCYEQVGYLRTILTTCFQRFGLFFFLFCFVLFCQVVHGT